MLESPARVEWSRSTDRFHGIEREAADEHREPVEQRPLPLVEQTIAPLDRREQRLMPAVGAPRSLGEQAEAIVEARGDLVRAEMSHARGRELDRERNAVEALADLPHRAVGRGGEKRSRRAPPPRDLRRAGSPRSRGPRRSRPRWGHVERWDLPHVLAVNVERLAARGEDRESRTATQQQVGDLGGAVHDVLAVVEHEQQVAVADAVHEPLLCGELDAAALVHQPGGDRNGCRNLPARARRGQVRAAHTRCERVRHVVGHLPGEPALAAAADAGQCHEAIGFESRCDLAARFAAADESRARPR